MATDVATRTWQIDPVHSSAAFAVRHLMISKVRGQFKEFSGTITTPANETIPTSIEATINAASIDTREAQRDGHLRSADFFDVEHHPHITFKSSRITANGKDRFIAHGSLTMHGVTKQIEMPGQVEGQVKDPYGKDRAAYSASLKLSRKEYGLVWNQAMETGGVMVGDDIEVTLEIEAVGDA